MVVFAFIIYAIHHFFIAEFVATSARWAANTLAGLGFEHAAYYAGLGWMNSNILYWGLFFAEIMLFTLLFNRQIKEVTEGT